MFFASSSGRETSACTFARSVATLLRITLVVGLHFGIWGVVVADVVVTAGVILWMQPFAPLIRPVFSPQVANRWPSDCRGCHTPSRSR
jgi:hypothetical protein